MIDLHNHMLPGLDDGAVNWEQSLAMGRMAVEDGIEGIICTPHWVNGYYPNLRETILQQVKTLQERLHAARVPLTVYPGAELHLDFRIPDRIDSGELATLNDTGKFALIELPVRIVPRNLMLFFWELKASDITPIISHPERNEVLQRDPSRLLRWVQVGALTQVTAASLLGRFGTEARKFAVSLMEHRLVHFLATDAHDTMDRIPHLSEAYREAGRIVGEETARRMVFENPQRVVRGEEIHPFEPIPYSKPSAPMPSPTPTPLKKIAGLLGLGAKRLLP